VLERIKRERAAGRSLAAIANGLNADRIPTAQGGRRWHPATIRYTLNRTR
jgi:Recombinase